MAQALRAEDLCKTYIVNKRQNNVLKNISFSIEEGEMVAVMGPSGSGKSTLLYSVSGMDRPTEGKVYIKDTELTELSEKDMANIRLARMGFIFQQMHMLKNLNIMDNIVLPAYQLHKGKAERAKVDSYGAELMRKLSITDIAENDITEVSGGQLQRACICRSIINKPDILFADEPTGALNRSSSEDVMKEMVRINEEGTTIMLVTHDMKVAAKCTRILYILDGRIEGELTLPSMRENGDVRDRENKLNHWLIDMGW